MICNFFIIQIHFVVALRTDRVINEEVHRRAGIERELSRADQVLRWFGHVERMDEYSMSSKVLMSEVCGGWVRGQDGRCEDCLGQQSSDCGGCATIRER